MYGVLSLNPLSPLPAEFIVGVVVGINIEFPGGLPPLLMSAGDFGGLSRESALWLKVL